MEFRGLLLFWLLATASVAAQEGSGEPSSRQSSADGDAADARAGEPEDQSQPASADGAGGVKTLSGMSILGNEEAPKSLVIVPWKSSALGDGIGVSNALDERARPVDKEVFMRELHYYELRSGGQD